MKSSFCIDLQRFMLIPTKFPLTHKGSYRLLRETEAVANICNLIKQQIKNRPASLLDGFKLFS